MISTSTAGRNSQFEQLVQVGTRGEVDSQDGVQDPPLEDDSHLNPHVHVARVVVRQRPVGDDVLGEHRLWLHGDDVWGDLHHRRLQLPDDQVHRAHLQHLQAQAEHDPHLSVEGVELQLVRALERLRVDLLERDPIELALEDVNLLIWWYSCSNKSESHEKSGWNDACNLNNVVWADNIIPFPRQCQFCVPRALEKTFNIKLF